MSSFKDNGEDLTALGGEHAAAAAAAPLEDPAFVLEDTGVLADKVGGGEEARGSCAEVEVEAEADAEAEAEIGADVFAAPVADWVLSLAPLVLARDRTAGSTPRAC
jgi:hypothetical protein